MRFESAKATEAWARDLARSLTAPVVVCLSGGLGAGKTQITRWCLEGLGVTGVASPTFAIHHRYEEAAVDHVDLYRIESAAELEDTGFWDLFTQDGIVFVEWADRLPRGAWPAGWTRVFIDVRVEREPERIVDLEIMRP